MRTMVDITSVRGAVINMALDIIGQKAKKFHTTEGRLCQECPLLAEIVSALKLAERHDTEEMVEKMREHYGLFE